MSSISSIPAGSQISPVDERTYHQSNLIGDWKGSWTKNNQPVELNVINIKGGLAQVEYTHNGHTERGTATVNGNTLTYGAVTIGTRDGKKAALEFSYGTATQSAILSKSAAPADQNKLVGNWVGSSVTDVVSFNVTSISGRDANVKYSINGQSGQGIADLYKNAVNIGKVQFASLDGITGTVTYQSGSKTLAIAVKRFTPPTAPTPTTSVNVLA